MLCVQTWIVIFAFVMITLFDINVLGFTLARFLGDVLFSLLCIFLVQWFCFNNHTTISWIFTALISILIFSIFYMWRTKDPVFMEIYNEEVAKAKASKHPQPSK